MYYEKFIIIYAIFFFAPPFKCWPKLGGGYDKYDIITYPPIRDPTNFMIHFYLNSSLYTLKLTETGIYRSDWSPPRHNYVGEFSNMITKKNSKVSAMGYVSINGMFYGRLDLFEPKSSFGYRSLYLTKISEGDQLHNLGYNEMARQSMAYTGASLLERDYGS